MAAKAAEGRSKRPPAKAAEQPCLLKGEDPQICGSESDPATASDAAKSMGVSTRSVESAIKVRREAAEEVAGAVDNGEISLNAASQLAKNVPDKEEQKKIVAGGKKASIRNCNPSSVNRKTIGRVAS
mgnify:FL=1